MLVILIGWSMLTAIAIDANRHPIKPYEAECFDLRAAEVQTCLKRCRATETECGGLNDK